MRNIIRAFVLACVSVVFSTTVSADEIVGTFSTPEGGGLWIMRVDAMTGAAGPAQVVAQDPQWRSLRKLALRTDADGRRTVAATAPVKGPGNLLFVDLDPLVVIAPSNQDAPAARHWADSPKAITRPLPVEVDEIRPTREGFLIGGDDGLVVHALLDPVLASAHCPGEPPCLVNWSMRAGLSPTGSKPEDIRVRPDGKSAWISLQKDSRKGDHRGHRLIRVSLPDLRVLGDIHLPRHREAHHPSKSPRDHGPSPEIIVEDPASNTLMLSLDNYGAVLLTDLDAALDGRLENSIEISTSLDGTFGSAYPDRVAIVDRPDGALALVANAGPEGGAVVIDLAARRRIAAVACRPGLESLAPVGDGLLVVGASAGKIKTRSDEGAVKRFEPAPEIVIFDLADPAAVTVRTFPRPNPVIWVAPVGSPGLVAAVERRSDGERDDLTLLRVTRAPDGAPMLESLETTSGPGRLDRVIAVPPRPALPGPAAWRTDDEARHRDSVPASTR